MSSRTADQRGMSAGRPRWRAMRIARSTSTWNTRRLPRLASSLGRNGSGWAEFLSPSLDPDAIVREVDKTDGYERWAPVGFRLAAALDHGTDHRSQICTALTTLGVEPLAIDVYSFGLDTRRVVEKLPDA